MQEMIAQTWYACKTVFYYVPLSACYVFLYYGFRVGFSIITASVIVTICNAVGDLSSGSNSRLWKYLIFYVLLYMAAQLMSLLFAVAVNPYIYEKIKDILNRKLSFAIQNMGIIALEDANVLERIHKAKACVEDCNLSICFMRIVSFLGNLGGRLAY